MPGRQSHEEQVKEGAAENGADTEEELGGLTVEELQQGQEAALALEDMMTLSAQTLVRAEVDELYQQVRPLGQGRFGQVLLVTHRQKGTRPGDRGGGVGPGRARQGCGARRPESRVAPVLQAVFLGSPLWAHVRAQRGPPLRPSHVASLSVTMGMVRSQAVCQAPSNLVSFCPVCTAPNPRPSFP